MSSKKQKTGVNPNNFFNKIITGGVDISATNTYRSSPSNNTLSEESLKLPIVRAIEEKRKLLDYTPFVPITSFSNHPKAHVTVVVFNVFPPDDECQGAVEHGPISTRVLTSVNVGGDGKDVYTHLDSSSQNPSIHATQTGTNRAIGWKCDISERKAQVATKETFAHMDIHPFPGHKKQADGKQKGKPLGDNYKKMRDAFDGLVMQYIIEIFEHGLLQGVELLMIQGNDTWDFFTVKFPKMFPDEFQRLINPLIIQHSPVLHGTAICKGPTPRQGYTFFEYVCDAVDYLRGSTNYHEELVSIDVAASLYCYGLTKNDGKEGDDHFLYHVKFDSFSGEDKRLFLARNLTHLQQLMTDKELGEGVVKKYPNQEDLKEGPQKLKTMGLTVEIEHFLDYYKRRGKQMKRSDWGVQNRAVHKEWKAFIASKREGEDEETEEEMQGGLEAILAAAALK